MNQALGSRSSGASLRRLVMERDHGICSQEGCGRDCLALVSRLKAVQDRHVRNERLLHKHTVLGYPISRASGTG